MVVDAYLRPRFRFLSDNESFWHAIKKGMQDKNERIVGFLKSIGQLRIGVKENWWPTIKSFQDIPKLGDFPISVPMIPIYAVSRVPLTLTFEEKEYAASLVVSFYPVYTFTIRITFNIREQISARQLIHFLKVLKSEKYVVSFKGNTFSDILNFSAFIKRKVIESIFQEDIRKGIKSSLSSMNTVIHLKGKSLTKDPKVLVGILLHKPNYEDISTSVLSSIIKHQVSFYKGDTIIASKNGFVAYTPYLYINNLDLQRKRFRRKLYYAAEIGYSVKRFLKNTNSILSIVINESPVNLYDMVSRLFITASPRLLSRFKSDFGTLKPHTLQKLFKNIALELELYRMYWRALNSTKDQLAKVLIPDLIQFFEKCKQLNNPLLDKTIVRIYNSSEISLLIPKLVKSLEKAVPQQYRRVASKILDYLIHEFRDDYRRWNLQKQRINLGWRRITKIAKATNIENWLFYENAPKGLGGLIQLLEAYSFIEVRKVPSPGRHGSAIEIRINPKHPIICNFLF